MAVDVMGEVGRETRKGLVREIRKDKKNQPRREHLRVTLTWPYSNLRDKRGFGRVSMPKSRFHVEMASQVKGIGLGNRCVYVSVCASLCVYVCVKERKIAKEDLGFD